MFLRVKKWYYLVLVLHHTQFITCQSASTPSSKNKQPSAALPGSPCSGIGCTTINSKISATPTTRIATIIAQKNGNINKVDKTQDTTTTNCQQQMNLKLDKIMSDLSKVMSKLEISNPTMTNPMSPKLQIPPVSTSSLVTTNANKACKAAPTNLKLKTFNGNKYYFPVNKMDGLDWEGADSFCRSIGMELISVETLAEWQFLIPEITKLNFKVYNWPWSSGNDEEQEGVWKWGTGSNITFVFPRNNWSDDLRENCLALFTEKWSALDCTDKMTFVCELYNSC